MLFHHGSFTHAAVYPNMRAVLKLLIGPNVQLHHSKMLVKPPEKGAAFPLHQDYPYFPHEKHSMLAASVHLDDSDSEKGCLRVIPGSYKQGILEHVGRFYVNHKKYPLSLALECPARAGDVLFFNYLTIHGSDINESNRPRQNILFQYRDASDKPSEQMSNDWGAGMMVCGENPEFRDYYQEFEMKPLK